ncbi:MAG: MotA/TolQ/ExbB proton channel family protein [Planctomycetota bacterium]
MLVGSCDGGREGIRSWQAGMLPTRIGRILLAACLMASWGVAATCVAPSVAFAQDEAAVDEDGDAEPEGKSYLTFLLEALGVKYVIIFLLLSFGLVALLVMCFMQFRKVVMMPPALGQQFEQHLENKEFQQAYELAKNDDSYLGKVLSAGMSKLQSGYPAAVEAMQAAENEQAMNLEHKISYVSLVGALAPMFGLLGTVDGMVAAFMLIAQQDTAPKPSQLAVGISQALVTTLIGLWLAIPAIACYGLLKNWLQRFNMEVDDESMKLMARFQNMGKK